MLYRYTYFIIENPLEEIWIKTITYWNSLKGEMVKTYISDNLLRRKLMYKHNSSGHFINKQFILSFGEMYCIEFGYNQDHNYTYITLEVGFHWFGRDNVWQIPQHYVTEWLDFLGYEPTHLQRGKTTNFMQITEQIEESEKRKNFNKYCTICGSRLNTDSTCSECGFIPYDLALTL